MVQGNSNIENGSFRKRQSFTMASNSAIRDKNMSLKAKGLYTLIMSYITLPDLSLTKDFLRKHCKEGKKAFEAAWAELKEKGYLKIYMQPSSDRGRWCVQYDLLDEADLADGVHTYYRNLAGEITDTNITKKEKRIPVLFHEPTVQPSALYPTEDACDQRTPHYGIYAKGAYAKGCNAKRGNNIILPYNTSNNTMDNHSLHPMSEERVGDSELMEQVVDELIMQSAIPYSYATDQKKMEVAIHYLTDWDFRQQHPYTTGEGIVDDQKMNAFNFCITCLVDMACAKEMRNYRGMQISCDQVIDAINCTSDQCIEGGLCEFLDEAVDDFMTAYKEKEIRDVRRYTMSVIWSCFSTYRVKQDITYLG